MKQPCLIVDDEVIVQDLVSEILAHLGVDSRLCTNIDEMTDNIAAHAPPMIFLDIGLKSADAMDAFHRLVEARYQGTVQLVSGREQDVLEAVQRAGADLGLRMRAPIKKPFHIEAIRQVLEAEGLLVQPTTGGLLARTDFEPLTAVSLWCKAWLSMQDDGLAYVETGIRSAVNRGRHDAPPDSPHEQLAAISWCLANLDFCADALSRVGAPASLLLPAKIAHLRRINIPAIFGADVLIDHKVALTLAFSEDDLFEDLTMARETMIHLRIQGVRIRVVNAGTRFLAMAGYHKLPVQEVTVDPQFTDSSASAAAQRRLAKLVEIAKRSGATLLTNELDGEADLKRCADAGFDWYERSAPPRVLPVGEFARRWGAPARDNSVSWRTIPVSAIGKLQRSA